MLKKTKLTIKYKYFLLTLICFSISLAFQAQNKTITNATTDTIQYTFRDTLGNFVLDSATHNLGQISQSKENNKLVKHFKYIGKEPIVITRAWTGDPHYICEYPKEPLVFNQVYSFTVCFWHRYGQDKLNKKMGFRLSDGSTITLLFIGQY
jgi:hypothetical protein